MPRASLSRACRCAALAMFIPLASCGLVPTPAPRFDTAARLHLASAAEASGDSDLALAMYAAATERLPHDPNAQARFALALTSAGRPGQATTVLEQALREAPTNATLLRQMARVELLTGHPEVALRRYDQVLALDASNLPARTGRGVTLDLLGRHADAQAEYRSVLARAPGNVAAGNNLGFSLMSEGRFAEGRDVLAGLTPDSPQAGRVQANLALARAGAGEPLTPASQGAAPADASVLKQIAMALAGT